jgi:hypothetical protein
MPVLLFAPCGASRGGYWPRNLRSVEFRGQHAPATRGSTSGLGAVARALWVWVTRARQKVVTRSGSSAKEQYRHEEHAQNFDEGVVPTEPENLSWSFSARLARRRLAQ